MVAEEVSPGGWECRLFCVPGQQFGKASAVLNYNRLPAPMVAFSRRFFGVPATRFYDDHQITEPSYALESGQSCHFRLHEIVRRHFDLGKHCGWGRQSVYCGVCTD